MDLRNMFSRSKHTSTSEKRRIADKFSGVGAHELFLEYDEFLGPSKPPPRRPSMEVTKHVTPRITGTDHKSDTKLLQDLSRDSEISYEGSRKSFSGLRDAIDDPRPYPSRVSSRRRKGLFSLKRSTREEPHVYPDQHSQSPPRYVLAQENIGRSPTRGWLRRWISSKSRGYPSPTSRFATIPPYYGRLIPENEDYTALPTLLGHEIKPYTAQENLPSGAAARAAAAAQNEILDSIRNLRLVESKDTGDSESGVGIEVRDCGDSAIDFDLDIPIVRKSK